jgi:hypothetical protein
VHGCRAVDRAAFIYTLSSGKWFQRQPVPRAGHPTDVSCATKELCVVVDLTGHAVRFDGMQWSTPEAVDVHREIRSVSCPTIHFCMTIDNLGYAARYAHGRWHTPERVFAVTDPNTGADISCGSPDFCGAVVYDGRAAIFANGRWHARRHIGAYAISCTASRQCFATGRGLSFYDGRWERPLASSHNFGPLSCVGSFCAVNSRMLWMRSHGVFAIGPRQGSGYGAVTCATRRFCLVSDNTYKGSGIAVDGASWAAAQIPLHNPKPGSSAAAFTAGDCSENFCMVLVGDSYVNLQETHASL